MNESDWKRIKEIFNDALDLPSEQRDGFIAEKCGDNLFLKNQVLEQICVYEKTGILPENPLFMDADRDETEEIQDSGHKMALHTLIADRYRVLDVAGVGGMGKIYRARDEALSDRIVALKRTQRAFKQLFEREIKILALLDHPNLPKVYDRVHWEGETFIVMQFINGQNLQEVLELQEHPFPLSTVLGWARVILSTLAYIHRFVPEESTIPIDGFKPILHHDIKPSNIMVTSRDDLYLLDFGIARSGGLGLTHNVTAKRFATLHYAPPEQVSGKQTDPSSDLFALAATLFYLMTGVRLPAAVVREEAIRSKLPDPINQAFQDSKHIVPSNVIAWLKPALALQQIDRPQSAQEMLDAMPYASTEKQASKKAAFPFFSGMKKVLWMSLAGMLLMLIALWGVTGIDISSQRSGDPTSEESPFSQEAQASVQSTIDLGEEPNDRGILDKQVLADTLPIREEVQWMDNSDTRIVEEDSSTSGPIHVADDSLGFRESEKSVPSMGRANFSLRSNEGRMAGQIIIDDKSLATTDWYRFPLFVGVHRLRVLKKNYQLHFVIVGADTLYARNDEVYFSIADSSSTTNVQVVLQQDQ